MDDIRCVGDTNKTSFLLFDSGEVKRTLNINNLFINGSVSNGAFIKIYGKTNEFHINNSELHNVKSYGSVIENLSKSSVGSISNLIFKDNINLNKLECGNIYFSNNLSISIENSLFNKNKCYGRGGAIAVNGGALYLSDNSDNNYDNNNNNNDNNIGENKNIEIFFENNIFKENYANNFGGAFYSNNSKFYLISAKNNSFINNKAGVMGGGIYFNNFTEKNLQNSIFKNNAVSHLIDDYNSKPSYFLLTSMLNNVTTKINSGDYFPLTFTLYNDFDNIITDINKYFNMITLKLEIIDKNHFLNNRYNVSEYYYIIGNIGTFVNGICELNNLQIFANPNEYVLIPKIENYDDDIKYKSDNIMVSINDCKEDQIKMINEKNKIQYCEDARCNENCPVDISARCIPFKNGEINDINKNLCECLSGWEGEICIPNYFIEKSEKFNIVNSLSIESLSSINSDLNISGFSINTTFRRMYSVNKNNKNNKCSNNDLENTLNNKINNTLNESCSKINTDNLFKISKNNINENRYSNTLDNGNNFGKKNSIEKFNKIEDSSKIESSISNFENFENIYIKNEIKKKSNKEIQKIQSNNGLWYYKCDLEKISLVYNSLELILIILIISKGKSVITYECIFKISKYIFYSSILMVVLGPTANIIAYVFLNNQRYGQVFFEVMLNLICFCIIYVLFSWDKVYYVFLKQGNISQNYFKVHKYKKCLIHETTSCECELELSYDDIDIITKKFIKFYKYCSTIFVIRNGKMSYITMKSKTCIIQQQQDTIKSKINIQE
ncbi:hypothetical protein PIROE2DRAFT_12876 [Piromyces sp. E2]|nr:hypothetical protein PIROE2DRAFT_12876 [Piromyces sp. E2]|eukprot:OUM61162.1 hypothetical protein PIROE2DRAFT_12876 [Piromyces sp. E2]